MHVRRTINCLNPEVRNNMEKQTIGRERMSFFQKYFGIKRVFDSFRYTCSGLREGLTEVAVKQELFFGLLHIIALCLVPISVMAKLFLTVVWLIWLCVELLNTAIEAVVDLVSPQWHALAKRAKDLGSAAVFCMIVAYFGSWSVVLIHHYYFA